MTASQGGAKPQADSRSAFIYHGPPSGVTLSDGEEILLHTGAPVRLPEGHEYTRTLLARKLLTPAPTPATAKPAKTSTNPTKTGS